VNKRIIENGSKFRSSRKSDKSNEAIVESLLATLSRQPQEERLAITWLEATANRDRGFAVELAE
jgi:hypothetical protein